MPNIRKRISTVPWPRLGPRLVRLASMCRCIYAAYLIKGEGAIFINLHVVPLSLGLLSKIDAI